MFSLMGKIDSTYNKVLLEDKRTKQAEERSKNVIRQFFNNADWLDKEFVHQDNPNHLSSLEYMFFHFKDQFYHNPSFKSGAMMRLMPMFCKIAFELGFQQSNPDNTKLNRLSQIMNLMFNLSSNNKLNLTNIDIENTTFNQLNNQFGQLIDQQNAEEEKRISRKEYTPNENYDIIGPVDYKTAKKYGNLSCPNSKLCYTQNESTWNQWTNNGINAAYIIVQKGFENIPPEHDDDTNSAYDTYGLSMIFAFVDPNGNLIKSNTRWNHNATYQSPYSCDTALNMEMISNIIGRPFKSVFKPNDKWTKLLATAQQRLQNGENPENFYEGFAAIRLNDKWNFINQKGELISNQWFDYASGFREGFAKVQLNGKRYKLGKDGKLYGLNESKTYNVRNPKKQVIRLTECDLHRIIKESINKIINKL